MNKMKIKIFTLLSLLITFSLTLSSCDSLWDDLNSITVSFDSNSGTGTMEPQEFEADIPQALNENTFTREGYTFAGWATSADATTAEYADKAEFTAKEDITLYAIWNIIPPVNPPAPESSKVTITYVSDKGTLPESKTVEQGYKLTAEDLPTLTETGYRFINWDKAIDDEITSDTTITASWIKTWTISYASNKTELNDKLPASKTVDEGYKLTADDLTALTADDYNFKGWDKSAGLEIKADVTITATWKKLVTISYSLPTGYSKDPKTVEEGYTLTAEDLPNETDTEYGTWDKTVGTEINTNTTIIATKWEDIVYLKNFKGIWDLITFKSNFEKTVFTEDTYTGDTTNTTIIDCSEDAHPGYFTGVISSDNKVFTIYGNGHRIYAPVNSSQLFSGFNKLSSIEFNNFYTSNVTNMYGMFAGTKLTSLDASKFNTSKVTDMTGMFETCEDISSLDLSSFDTSSVTNMTKMFKECKELTTLNVSSFDTSKVTDMSSMFDQCEKLVSLNLSKFKTSEVTTMGSMFYECKELTSLDISKFDTSKVIDMKSMFQGCEKLTSLDLSSFDTSSVTDMTSMFYECKELISLDVSKFITSSVTGMIEMFRSCEKLTSLDLSSFDTSSITDMTGMFYNCKELTSLDVSKFDTSKVTTMKSMFQGCEKITVLDISSFTSTKLPLKSFFSDVCNYVFKDCSSLVTIYANADFSLGLFEVFDGCTSLVGGAGTKYSDVETSDPTSYKTAVYARIDTAANPGYFTLKQ